MFGHMTHLMRSFKCCRSKQHTDVCTTKHVVNSTTPKIEDCITCVICFGEITNKTIKTLPCGHSFDNICILMWFRRNESCPVCRAKYIVAFI